MMDEEQIIKYLNDVKQSDSIESIVSNIKGLFLGIVKKQCFNDDASMVDIALNTKSLMASIPDLLYLNKAEHWVFHVFNDHRDKKALAWKFNSGDPKMIDNTRRQLQLINQINELNQIEYFAKLTKAWVYNEIDDALYFKLANVLTRCICEELKYLEYIISDELVERNIYVDSFEYVGFTKMVSISSNGINMYKYTDLAKSFKKYAVDFVPDYKNWLGTNETLKLENIKAENREADNGIEIEEF